MDNVISQLKLQYCVMQVKMLCKMNETKIAQEKEVYKKIMHTINDAFSSIIPA